jgi:hypothetical protein
MTTPILNPLPRIQPKPSAGTCIESRAMPTPIAERSKAHPTDALGRSQEASAPCRITYRTSIMPDPRNPVKPPRYAACAAHLRNPTEPRSCLIVKPLSTAGESSLAGASPAWRTVGASMTRGAIHPGADRKHLGPNYRPSINRTPTMLPNPYANLTASRVQALPCLPRAARGSGRERPRGLALREPAGGIDAGSVGVL